MSSAMIHTEIASRNFVVDASRERVWRLIGKVIFSSLPGMEEVEILDERSFRAFLRIKVSWIELRMRLKGEIVDMTPPHSLAVDLTIVGPGGLFKTNQKVTLDLTAIEARRTAVACKTTAEGGGTLFRGLLRRQARRFAHSTFEAIEKRLQELA